MVAKLEEADRAMRETGHQQLWFKKADPSVVQVAGECNGFLFEQLLRASGYGDVECVNLLREGGRFLFVCVWVLFFFVSRGSCFIICEVRLLLGSSRGVVSGQRLRLRPYVTLSG